MLLARSRRWSKLVCVSSRSRHTRCLSDWSSDVCSSDLLRLPDLDHAKRTVLSSLGSPDSSRAYAHVIDDFIAWYCSEPRLAFGKHVVLRYRIELESRLLAPATINVRLAAVR